MQLLLNPSLYAPYYQVTPGDFVKLAFSNEVGVENMWVRVIAACVSTNIYAGRLDNSPFIIDLEIGAGVIFRKEHVYCIMGRGK